MNKKRFLGFVLVLFGLLLTMSRVALTGAVIGIGKASFLNLTSASIMIAGLILVLTSRNKPHL